MAQHYVVNLNKEIEVRKSVTRIGKYLAKSPWLVKRIKGGELLEKVYTKNIQYLPQEYKERNTRTGVMDWMVLVISPYKLPHTKVQWTEYWKEAYLECHFDKEGNINKVYYPL